MSEQWNFANVWEEVARRFPHRIALIHGEREVSWRDFERHAEGLAATLLASGLGHQAKVAQYQRNTPEYLETMFGAFKASFVPLNTNYRYGDAELVYLWTDSDTEAVVFDAEFTDTVARVRTQLPRIRLWIRVGASAECPDWAIPYDAAVAHERAPFDLRSGRSGDDLDLLYTGGTTGKPKGVMWRQDDLFQALERQQGAASPTPCDVESFVDAFGQRPIPVLPAAPLMHGTACWFALPILSRGGSVVTLTSRSLDAVELLDTLQRRRVKGLCIAGNAFAKPLLDELHRSPDRWDLSDLRVITSSGAILSEANKRSLLSFATGAMIVDSLGSSESGAIARSTSSSGSSASKASFTLSPNARVIDDLGRDVVPGSGESGRLALSGFIPTGYYGDPEKTAAAFVTIGGRRFVIPGDLAVVSLDGTVTLLGRGSSCINTAGEKVYPEEVEETLKTLPGVVDAGVFGMPDDSFGEAVTAVVLLENGVELDERALIAGVKQHLAGYKAPRRVIATTSFPRGPNGKLEFVALRAIAAAAEPLASNDRSR